jgi:hypothetical protein
MSVEYWVLDSFIKSKIKIISLFRTKKKDYLAVTFAKEGSPTSVDIAL